jgi:hypothetical protein
MRYDTFAFFAIGSYFEDYDSDDEDKRSGTVDPFNHPGSYGLRGTVSLPCVYPRTQSLRPFEGVCEYVDLGNTALSTLIKTDLTSASSTGFWKSNQHRLKFCVLKPYKFYCRTMDMEELPEITDMYLIDIEKVAQEYRKAISTEVQIPNVLLSLIVAYVRCF